MIMSKNQVTLSSFKERMTTNAEYRRLSSKDQAKLLQAFHERDAAEQDNIPSTITSAYSSFVAPAVYRDEDRQS